MKRAAFLIAIALTLFMAHSLAAGDITSAERRKESNFYKRMKIKAIKKINMGSVISETRIGPDGKVISIAESGSRTLNAPPDGAIKEFKYEKDLIIEAISKEKDGKVFLKQSFIYDSNENLIEVRYLNAGEKNIGSEIYEYEKGLPVKKIFKHADGDSASMCGGSSASYGIDDNSYKYLYKNGKLKEETSDYFSTTADGGTITTTVYDYDGRGRLLTKTSNSRPKQGNAPFLKRGHKIKYEYDAQGLLKSETIEEPGNLMSLTNISGKKSISPELTTYEYEFYK